MNFSHLSGWGLSLPRQLAVLRLLDQVAKLGKEGVAGPKCEGLGAPHSM